MQALAQSILHPSELVALGRHAWENKTKAVVLPSPEHPDYANSMLWSLLGKTSRSFARVISSLDHELRLPVCVFYVVLRALDTVEDDCNLALDVKLPLLKSFYKNASINGWTFDGISKDDPDRIVLVHFDCVVDQLSRLKPEYQSIILDITRRMGEGMAEFAGGKQVVSMHDYDLYTHYVAGLVGIGLTDLFVASGLEGKLLAGSESIANEMGLFLQKVNILKDYLTDIKYGRLFWPRAVWQNYVAEGQGVEALARPENIQSALACLNHLCANALCLAPSCLEYISRLQNNSVLQFAAIPQLMAIASIDLFYNNPLMFQRCGNKIRRGLAAKLINRAGNINSIKQIYFDYATNINNQARAALGTNPVDKSHADIMDACAKIVKWIQIHDQKAGLPIRTSSKSYSAVIASFVLLAGTVFVPILVAWFLAWFPRT